MATEALRVPVIDRFRGEYFFLSNFYPAVPPHRGRLFPTSEHAYMAAKTGEADAIDAILTALDPLEAQRIGRAAPLVDGVREFESHPQHLQCPQI
ncbi:NADAR family protein [Mycobacterium marinum]|uniref:NADAR family protein n=1 Tax=Mycobacterium marinum TaxID=1781 RepID=UPI00113FF4CE|nr:NADAR family protein [Mycobacterium marinum]